LQLKTTRLPGGFFWHKTPEQLSQNCHPPAPATHNPVSKRTAWRKATALPHPVIKSPTFLFISIKSII
jgi:hypothetical protein